MQLISAAVVSAAFLLDEFQLMVYLQVPLTGLALMCEGPQGLLELPVEVVRTLLQSAHLHFQLAQLKLLFIALVAKRLSNLRVFCQLFFVAVGHLPDFILRCLYLGLELLIPCLCLFHMSLPLLLVNQKLPRLLLSMPASRELSLGACALCLQACGPDPLLLQLLSQIRHLLAQILDNLPVVVHYGIQTLELLLLELFLQLSSVKALSIEQCAIG
mmetsp:Transcript_159070/g.510133  ORF Transcript_159070/g.510133 Transcript_159070/m.510133 type:complete len:215 (+) Transcript_159070:664-1308(+)